MGWDENVLAKPAKENAHTKCSGYVGLRLNCLTRESKSCQTSHKRAGLSFGTAFVDVFFSTQNMYKCISKIPVYEVEFKTENGKKAKSTWI